MVTTGSINILVIKILGIPEIMAEELDMARVARLARTLAHQKMVKLSKTVWRRGGKLSRDNDGKWRRQGKCVRKHYRV